jgi:hypothetical protein
MVSSVSNFILIVDESPGAPGEAVTDCGCGGAALAFPGLNRPKASMVATTPNNMINVSPKDFPILVFIYSYLLVLCA